MTDVDWDRLSHINLPGHHYADWWDRQVSSLERVQMVTECRLLFHIPVDNADLSSAAAT